MLYHYPMTALRVLNACILNPIQSVDPSQQSLTIPSRFQNELKPLDKRPPICVSCPCHGYPDLRQLTRMGRPSNEAVIGGPPQRLSTLHGSYNWTITKKEGI